jgi:hypothetical protein
MSEPLGILQLEQMISINRAKILGIFDTKLLKKQLKQMKPADRVEIVSAEHQGGGYGLAVRPYGSTRDEWLTLAPLVEVDNGISV